MTVYKDYNALASKDIRTFLWDLLKNAEILDEKDYYVDGFCDDALIPIIPSQQVPEFNNLLPGKTYIYYDYEVLPSTEQWWITDEIMTLNIVGFDYDQINKIFNYITEIFRRYDMSALWTNHYYDEANWFKFHYIRIESIQSPVPFQSEGGPIIGEIQLNYCYSRVTDYNGMF